MLKKLFKMATVLTLLIGCYLGYVRAFAAFVSRLSAAHRVEDFSFTSRDSKSKKEAIVRAREAFGRDHWTAEEELQLRYYNPERGFWMYAQNYNRSLDEDPDGKRLRLKPAGIIWRGKKDKGGTLTITSDEAIVDFNQSLGFNPKPGSEPMTVKFARLTGNVMIRDDRGTPGDPKDDLVIGPLTYVDYDDNKLQMRSDSDILLVDRDMRLTGQGMLIQLRPKGEQPSKPGGRATGFEGAQSARIDKRVRIVFSDVGQSGILPGSTATTKKTGPGSAEITVAVDPSRDGRTRGVKAKAPTEPVPLDVQADGPMLVELPKAPKTVAVGPPAPSAPTLVHFTRNVVVRRGKLTELPDQLTCDVLDLTLYPSEKPQPDGAKKGASKGQDKAVPDGEGEEKGIMGDLVLRRAKATGHAVWLQLPGQGAKIGCNELIHDKLYPASPNRTYFRGDATRKLWVEKQDFVVDAKGVRKLQSVTYIRTIDATLLDEGEMTNSTLVASGPGQLDTYPAPDPSLPRAAETPPDRTAVWHDRLYLKNELGAQKQVVRKTLILTGRPRINDRLQDSSLAARDRIDILLKPAPETTPPGASAGENPGKFQIERLFAYGDAHLIAPGKNLAARTRLEAEFEQVPVAATGPAAPSTAVPTAVADAEPVEPAGPETKAEKPAEPKKAEPKMAASADRVHARVRINPRPVGSKPAASSGQARPQAGVPGAGEADYELREVRMWGDVNLHQDPEPGKKRGQDARGQMLVMVTSGPGKAVLNIYDREASRTPEEKARTMPPAWVKTDDGEIEGGRIGLNQQTDLAWVYGPGRMLQMTDPALLTDRAQDENAAGAGKDARPGDQQPAADRPKPRKRAGKVLPDRVPMWITWTDRMTFEGRSVDPSNRPAARAIYYGKVQAQMEDAEIKCSEKMIAYTDQPVPLAELGKMKQARGRDQGGEEGAAPEKRRPDLALLDCYGNALAVSRKVDPDRPILLSQQVVVGDRLIYDRRSGEFLVPGPGKVYLYDRQNSQAGPVPEAETPPIANRKPISPVSDPGPRNRTQGSRRGAARDDGGRIARTKPATPVPPRAPAIPPLILTQIQFAKGMKGRIGTGKQDDTSQIRWAEFFQDIEVARGPVPKEGVFDYDHLPPKETYYLTSQTLRVVTEPPPSGSPAQSPSRNFLKAWDDAFVTTVDKTLQADELTYDSLTDLIYANGKDGRQVIVAQQVGPGQQASPMRAEAVQMNPKTGAAHAIAPETVQLLDARTGVRPTPVAPPDPNAKPPKRRKAPFRGQPKSNIERKGFTGM